MSKREEDFDTQSDKYVEMRKSFGVNDPYAIKEIGEDIIKVLNTATRMLLTRLASL